MHGVWKSLRKTTCQPEAHLILTTEELSLFLDFFKSWDSALFSQEALSHNCCFSYMHVWHICDICYHSYHMGSPCHFQSSYLSPGCLKKHVVFACRDTHLITQRITREERKDWKQNKHVKKEWSMVLNVIHLKSSSPNSVSSPPKIPSPKIVLPAFFFFWLLISFSFFNCNFFFFVCFKLALLDLYSHAN